MFLFKLFVGAAVKLALNKIFRDVAKLHQAAYPRLFLLREFTVFKRPAVAEIKLATTIMEREVFELIQFGIIALDEDVSQSRRILRMIVFRDMRLQIGKRNAQRFAQILTFRRDTGCCVFVAVQTVLNSAPHFA